MSPEPLSAPGDSRPWIKGSKPMDVITDDKAHTAAYPPNMATSETADCNHSRLASSWKSTLTTMAMVTICCSSEAGTSITQPIACPALCTSDSTPAVSPRRYTAASSMSAATTNAPAACIRSAKSRVRRGGMSSMTTSPSAVTSGSVLPRFVCSSLIHPPTLGRTDLPV